MTGKGDLATSVLDAVGRVENVDPTALDDSLFEAIDGDALDRLFRDTTGRVTFEYHGYEVTVTSEADVSVAPMNEEG